MVASGRTQSFGHLEARTGRPGRLGPAVGVDRHRPYRPIPDLTEGGRVGLGSDPRAVGGGGVGGQGVGHQVRPLGHGILQVEPLAERFCVGPDPGTERPVVCPGGERGPQSPSEPLVLFRQLGQGPTRRVWGHPPARRRCRAILRPLRGTPPRVGRDPGGPVPIRSRLLRQSGDSVGGGKDPGRRRSHDEADGVAAAHRTDPGRIAQHQSRPADAGGRTRPDRVPVSQLPHVPGGQLGPHVPLGIGPADREAERSTAPPLDRPPGTRRSRTAPPGHHQVTRRERAATDPHLVRAELTGCLQSGPGRPVEPLDLRRSEADQKRPGSDRGGHPSIEQGVDGVGQ
jgi:hypothetical protein